MFLFKDLLLFCNFIHFIKRGGRLEMIGYSKALNNVYTERLLDHSASRDEELESKLNKTQDWL